MKKRWIVLLALAAALVSLFLPAVKVYVHSQLGEETAALFPSTLSLGSVALKGADSLPVHHVPALGVAQFGGWMLIAGLVLMALGALAALVKRKGSLHLAALLTVAAMALMGTFTFQLMNVTSSLLFTLLLDVQAWAYVPLVAGLAQLIVIIVWMKGGERLSISDKAWRRLGGVLAIAAVACMLLPSHVVSVPETITDNPADAAAMNRSHSLVDEMLGREPNLSTIAKQNGVFQNVLSGDLKALEPYSADGYNIKGVFAITLSTASINVYLLGAVILLILGAILAFLPRVDRWFPLSLHTLAAVLLAAAVFGVLTIGEGDMFTTATRQLCRLGVGQVTVVPFLVTLLGAGAGMCGVMSVRYANSPYFVNPIPQRSRLRVTAMALAVVTVVMLLLPSVSFSFVKPGKSKVQSTVAMSGAQALIFQTPEDILHPKDSRGRLLYEAEAKNGGLNDAAVESAMRDIATSYSVTTWACLLLCLAGIAALAMKVNKRVPILLFLAALAVRLLTWLLVTLQTPKVIGSAAGTISLYISLPLLIFAAFFSNFSMMEELPKKYKLFLMMLPFLVAVFLFSYLPLYGWSYAFYNYKFGLPMSEQEFVGFKWFTEMVTNPGHRENILRVLKNTFGMSGLNLLTSWLPMVFAIFLNEITRTRFKKFVQIFTTLPNFISWALVFSFAMCLFSMDTGIYTKFMLAIGAIDQPVAWLNSSAHIWIKMWAWNTWKGLGWGAIMYLAAIAGIDQELYEAAKVDGANRWMQMRYITLPCLLPTFFVLLMLSISNILNNGMEQYMVFQNSMNKNTIEVLDLYVYNITIASKGTTLYSFATAIGILKTLVSVTLLFSANFVSKKLRGESIV